MEKENVTKKYSMRPIMKLIIPILILLVGYGAMKLLIGMKSDNNHHSQAIRSKLVEIEVINLGTISPQISAFGRAKTAQPVQLISEVAGLLQTGSLSFQPARSFQKGDLLLRIDDRSARLDLNSAISELLTALANFLPEIKSSFPDRFQVWQDYFDNCNFDQAVSPLPEPTDRKIKLYLARFNVYKLYFKVRSLEIIYDKHFIHAPFDGAIVSVALHPGATARPGAILGEILNLEKMEMEVPLPAEDVDWINFDKNVNLTATESNQQWQGHVLRIGKSIDPATQTVPVYISIDGAEASGMIHGVFMEAVIPGRPIEQAVIIPRRAMYENGYVYLIKNGLLEYRQVSVARQENETVIIDGGLFSGDSLVTQILQGVSPGMPALARGRQVEETR